MLSIKRYRASHVFEEGTWGIDAALWSDEDREMFIADTKQYVLAMTHDDIVVSLREQLSEAIRILELALTETGDELKLIIKRFLTQDNPNALLPFLNREAQQHRIE